MVGAGGWGWWGGSAGTGGNRKRDESGDII